MSTRTTLVLTRDEATEMIIAARRRSGLSWAELAKTVGRSPVWTVLALTGDAAMSPEEAAAAASALGLGDEVADALQLCPLRGSLDTTVPVDPLLYRFHEITQMFGPALKELIHEEFGDGIMSAIDFTCEVERVEDPAGDRVKVTYNGKFLPYRKF